MIDRARAESFGAVAALYDRCRPRYPAPLIDALVALRPSRVLDVGCGTGQVGGELARRGLSVVGVEPDPRMAALARGHGLTVETSTFETWDDGGRLFDLACFGASWHWIDPARGLAKLARVLRPGGTLARFWTHEVPDAAVSAALEDVYGRLAPHATRFVPPPPAAWADPVADDGAFCALETRTYDWSRTLSAEAWIGMVTTFSDHQRLPPERLAALQEALADAIAALGGSIHVRCGTYVRWAQRTAIGA